MVFIIINKAVRLETTTMKMNYFQASYLILAFTLFTQAACHTTLELTQEDINAALVQAADLEDSLAQMNPSDLIRSR